MSKFVETSYLNKKEILKFGQHHVQIAVTISDDGIEANADHKKIVPAGTILGGKGTGTSFLSADNVQAVEKNTAEAEGILLEDVDVTYGPKEGAVVLHGFVKLSALPTAPTKEAIAALKQITFIK